MCVCPPPHNRPRLPGRVNGAYGKSRDGRKRPIDPTDQASNAAATKGTGELSGAEEPLINPLLHATAPLIGASLVRERTSAVGQTSATSPV